MKFRTRAIHVGNERDPQTGAVVPPLHVASTFVQPGAGEWGEFDYGRSGNPTRRQLADDARLAGSGQQCARVRLRHGGDPRRDCMLLEAGDHVLAGATSTAAPIGCCTRSCSGLASTCRWSPRRILTAVEAAITPAHAPAVDRESRESADVDHRHLAACAEIAQQHGLWWPSTTPLPRPC